MSSNLATEPEEFNLDPPSRLPWVAATLGFVSAIGGLVWGWTEHKKTFGQAEQLKAAVARGAASDATKEEERTALTQRIEALESEKATLQTAKEGLSKDVEAKADELAKLKGTYDQLQEQMKSEVKKGDIQLTQTGGKLRVDLVDKILFNSGEAQISKRGESVLARVGAILANIDDKQIQVSGHTDQTPIGEKRSGQFPSNWELSVARATHVVRFLQDKAGVPPERLVASGYGEYHPIATNKTATGRARNRRIEILLTPSLDPKLIGKTKLKAEAKATPSTPTKSPHLPSAHHKHGKS